MAQMIGRTKSWLTWLAGAALALIFGGAGCAQGEPPVPVYGAPPSPPPPAKPPDATPAASLEDSAQWKQVVSAWSDAEKFMARESTESKQGKVDEAQKKPVLAGIETAKTNVGLLLGSGLLSAAEAECLKEGLGSLASNVSACGIASPTCYTVMEFTFERASAAQLARRMPLLEKLVGQGKITPAAADRVLASIKLLNIDGDLASLGDAGGLQRMPADEREKIVKTRDAVKAAVEKLKKQLETQKP